MLSNGRFRLSNASGRRDRHDIVAEILETARGGAIKTHIMYKAKLSYSQLEEYTTLLVEKGFLQKHAIFKRKRTQDIFKTSEQGEEFIRSYRTLDRRFPFQTRASQE
jgi:predicted transcriptional regulator